MDGGPARTAMELAYWELMILMLDDEDRRWAGSRLSHGALDFVFDSADGLEVFNTR